MIEEVERAVVLIVEAATLDRKHRSVRPLELRLERATVRLWRVQRDAVLAALASRRALTESIWLREAVTPEDFDPVEQAVEHNATYEADLRAIIEVAAARGARDVIAELDAATAVSFDVADETVSAWLSEHAAERVVGIDDVTRQAVRRILIDAADRGWSYAKTATALKERFAGFGARSPLKHIRSRGELIAVTEVGDAYEYAGQVVANRLRADGIAIEKQWLVAGDDRVCSVCSPAGAQGWIPDDGTTAFVNGLDGPLGHPGCRCATARRTAPTTPKDA